MFLYCCRVILYPANCRWSYILTYLLACFCMHVLSAFLDRKIKIEFLYIRTRPCSKPFAAESPRSVYTIIIDTSFSRECFSECPILV